MKLILLGPPGCGKDTQAEIISKILNIPIIAIGNILRKYAKKNDELGKQIKEVIDTGDLLPNKLINTIIDKSLKEEDCKDGYILDGYPRNLEQAAFLDTIVAIDKVISLTCSDEVLIQRISNRRVCICGESYNVITNPPSNLGICNACGKSLEQRDDDKAEVVANRLNIYHKQTEPLISYYKEKRLLAEIDGEVSIEKVAEQIQVLLGE